MGTSSSQSLLKGAIFLEACYWKGDFKRCVLIPAPPFSLSVSQMLWTKKLGFARSFHYDVPALVAANHRLNPLKNISPIKPLLL